MMERLRFGIVGTGAIANVVAKSINNCKNAELTAVVSRRKVAAENFADKHKVETVCKTWNEMLDWGGIDAVYVAIPTFSREDVCIAAAQHKKHVLAEKPFSSLKSLQNILVACRKNGAAFMDGTHFPHHPRTKIIKSNLLSEVGVLQTVRTSFLSGIHFSEQYHSSNCYNTEQEPMGVIGNLAWYSMRAIAEFMPERLKLKTVESVIERDTKTGAVIRGAGILVFENNFKSIWEVGYNAGADMQDLDIIGSKSVISIDDAFIDWYSMYGSEAATKVGYIKKTGRMNPADSGIIRTPCEYSQVNSMINNFVDLARCPGGEESQRSMKISMQTQEFLDAIWEGGK